MVPNPPYHPGGDFALRRRHGVALDGDAAADLRQHRPLRHRAVPRTSARRRSSNCCRYLQRWIADGRVSGETLRRPVGQRRHAGRPRASSMPRSRPRVDGRDATVTPRPRQAPSTDMTRPTTIRCSISRGLPRFDAIRAEHVTPAVDALLARRARRGRAPSPRTPRPPTWDTVAEPLADALDRLDRAWGAVAPSQRGREHARAARRVQRATCRRSPRSTPTSAQDLRLFAPLSRARRVARRSRRSTPRSASAIDNELRDFRLGGAELPRGAEGAPQGGARRSSPSSRRSSTTTCSTRPTPGRSTSTDAARAGRRAGRRARRGARRGRGRRQARLEAHAAHAVLSAGDELRRQPRAARDAASRLRDARLRPRRDRRSGTTAR